MLQETDLFPACEQYVDISKLAELIPLGAIFKVNPKQMLFAFVFNGFPILGWLKAAL